MGSLSARGLKAQLSFGLSECKRVKFSRSKEGSLLASHLPHDAIIIKIS